MSRQNDQLDQFGHPLNNPNPTDERRGVIIESHDLYCVEDDDEPVILRQRPSPFARTKTPI